ncbi:unnamed protein product [Enterobius vermicularis]|uniref:LITAF domain-containing protein n=1 Tax=Enterobius vermicularis TaxID=51028 RepID=A0A0N4VA02_ENTVE|nr:unnamed protein product [Enterobius vermicularis]
MAPGGSNLSNMVGTKQCPPLHNVADAESVGSWQLPRLTVPFPTLTAVTIYCNACSEELKDLRPPILTVSLAVSHHVFYPYGINQVSASAAPCWGERRELRCDRVV